MNDKEIINKLTEEILTGKIKRDILKEEAFEFTREYQAMYFSRARRAIQSEVAYTTMTIAQDTRELDILKSLNLNNKVLTRKKIK